MPILESDFQKIPPKEIRAALGRAERINLLLSPQQKKEIRAAAERYGLSMTDYLLRIHALVEDGSRNPHRKR